MGKMITSTQNRLAKKIRELGDKKYRRLYGEYLVEGVKPVRECVAAGCEVSQVVCTPRHADEFAGCEVFSDDLFERVSTEESPQGVLAVVRVPDDRPEPPTGSCVLLDGLQDCGNVGTIIRTANAAGYREVYCLNCADAYAPKTVRASMGGIFFVRVMRGGTDEILSALRDVPLVAADMDGGNIYDYVPPSRFCLCVGNEGSGLSESIRASSRAMISIPMASTCESLNAAVSAGIAMYQLKYGK